MDLITAHLKSKLLTFPGGRFTPRNEEERAQVAGIALMRRMAEAVTLRIWVNGLLGGAGRTPLLLLGDLNDVPEAQERDKVVARWRSLATHQGEYMGTTPASAKEVQLTGISI